MRKIVPAKPSEADSRGGERLLPPGPSSSGEQDTEVDLSYNQGTGAGYASAEDLDASQPCSEVAIRMASPALKETGVFSEMLSTPISQKEQFGTAATTRVVLDEAQVVASTLLEHMDNDAEFAKLLSYYKLTHVQTLFFWFLKNEVQNSTLRTALVKVSQLVIKSLKANGDIAMDAVRGRVAADVYEIGPHCIWVCLRYMKHLQLSSEEHSISPEYQHDCSRRIAVLRVLIQQVVERYEDRQELHCVSLTYPYEGPHAVTALELAMQLSWISFFSWPKVKKCMQYIQKGFIQRTSMWSKHATFRKFRSLGEYLNVDSQPSKPAPAPEDSSPEWWRVVTEQLFQPRVALLGMPADTMVRLLRLPLFAYSLEVLSFLGFTLIFTLWVILRMNGAASQWSLCVLVWVYVLAIGIDEVQQLRAEKSSLYFRSVVNLLDSLLLFIFLAAAVLLLIGLSQGTTFYTELSADLSTCAIAAVYMRFLLVAVQSRTLGLLVVGLSRVVLATAPLALFLVVFLVSCAVAYTVLCHSPIGGTSTESFQGSLSLLFQGIFGNADFDAAQECHPYFGVALLAFFLIVAVIIILNSFLIAVMSSVFQNMEDNSIAEYEFTRTTLFLRYFLDFEHGLQYPPFNLLMMPIDILCCRAPPTVRVQVQLIVFRFLVVAPFYTLCLVLYVFILLVLWALQLLALLVSPFTWPFASLRFKFVDMYKLVMGMSMSYEDCSAPNVWRAAVQLPVTAVICVLCNLCYYILLPFLVVLNLLRVRPLSQGHDERLVPYVRSSAPSPRTRVWLTHEDDYDADSQEDVLEGGSKNRPIHEIEKMVEHLVTAVDACSSNDAHIKAQLSKLENSVELLQRMIKHLRPPQ